MLTDDQLRAAHAAAIEASLDRDRDTLLAAFERTYVLHLRAATSHTTQIWEDLCALRNTGPAFLATWLETAAHLADPRPQAAVFRELAAQARAQQGPHERPPWSGAWVGRTGEMASLAAALTGPHGAPRPVAICALHGMGGVGKTYLAERFAWQHSEFFPGGVKRLALRPAEAPAASTLLGELAALLEAPAASPAEVRARLLIPRTLVHVDNADDENAAGAAADLARALHGCALIVTGRYTTLGERGAWTVVNVAPFDEPTALAQLAAEYRPPTAGEQQAFAHLARELGHLPLALSLAAAHLREGPSPEDFLERLEADHLDIDHPDPATGDSDPRRRNLARTLSLSLELLRTSLRDRGAALLQAFHALGHAPAAGIGASLGAALTGLSRSDFLRLAAVATRLSLLDRATSEPPRWRLHPLVAELVRRPADAEAVFARMTDWFVARLPEESEADSRPQGERWNEAHAETPALVDWLARVPVPMMPAVERAGSWYAMVAGPFAAWSNFCKNIVAAHEDSLVRSNALWTLGNVARSAGDAEHAFAAAQQKQDLDLTAGRQREAALAAGLRADILQARGQLDEALRIRKEDQLPVYEKLGARRDVLVCQAKMAIAMLAGNRPGDRDEAQRLLRLALTSAQEMRLPEAEQIRKILTRAGFDA